MKYFPILKAKAGEFSSLAKLSNSLRYDIVPVIELVADCENATRKHLVNEWDFPDNRVIIDPFYFRLTGNSFDAYLILLRELKEKGVNVIPAVGVDDDASELALIRDYQEEFDCQICVRPRGLGLRPKNLRAKLDGVNAALDVTDGDLIVILDYGFIDKNNVDTKIISALEAVEVLLPTSTFKRVVVGGGSFPVNLNDMVVGRRYELKRFEWQLWVAVISEFLSDDFGYCDYGTRHPIFSDEPVAFAGSCSLRYSTEPSFMVYRGQKAQDHRDGNLQYHHHCEKVSLETFYDGPTFSWADNQINDRAGRSTNPGNATTWVTISLVRHFTKIASLL